MSLDFIKNESFYVNPQNFVHVARGFFQVDCLNRLRSEIKVAKDRLNYVPSSSREHEAELLGVAPNSLRLNQSWYKIWKKAKLNCLYALVPDFEYVIYPPQIRTIKERRGFVDWHQDSGYMSAMARTHAHVMTCFVPLNDYPSTVPTVQFHVNPDQSEVEHTHLSGREVNHVVAFNQGNEENNVSFDLELGDVLLFGSQVLHRTYFKEESFDSRDSMEFRLITANSRLSGKDYYSLAEQAFSLFEL